MTLKEGFRDDDGSWKIIAILLPLIFSISLSLKVIRFCPSKMISPCTISPGEGIILRLSGQFWRLRRQGPEAAATAVVEFRAQPGALTTETRVHVPDPVSRRKFVRYWRVVRPFSGVIRLVVLRAAKRRAEAA